MSRIRNKRGGRDLRDHRTAKYGLIGHPIGHSLSPQLHSIFARYGRGYRYDRIDIEADELERVLRDTSYRGFNVTSPYKRAVLPFLDELTPEAEALQAVNTIERTDDGRLIGHNTDVYGFIQMTGARWIRGRKVLVFGTGGAASAACEGLRRMDARSVYLVSRSGELMSDDRQSVNAERADSMIGSARRADHQWEIPTISYADLPEHLDAEVLINATPVGMSPHGGASPLDGWRTRCSDFEHLESAYDMIYRPYRTQFLMDAAAAGAYTRNGLRMLVWQGLRSAQIWGELPESGRAVHRRSTRNAEPMRHGRKVDIGWAAFRQLRQQQLNVVVIGMPGSGKSSISRQLAFRLHRPFVDVDRAIQEQEGASAAEIIRTRGEAAFRAIETETLRSICRRRGQVIATGGGAIVRPENIPILRANSIVVYLRRPLAMLSRKDRPISEKEGLEALYQQRAEKYESAADLILDNAQWFGETKNGVQQGTYREDIRNYAEWMRSRIVRCLNEDFDS